MNWTIQIRLTEPRAKTARWVTYRHRNGSKNVARFNTLGALRRFVKHHCLALSQTCRAHNEVSHEYQAL
jgi:hypothetical protein